MKQMTTVTLRNGLTVLAEPTHTHLRRICMYPTREKAQRRAAQVGGLVYHSANSPAFYVVLGHKEK